MSDPTELVHAELVIRKTLATHGPLHAPKRSALAAALRDPRFGYTSIADGFAACFTATVHTENHWREYGRGGLGYALEFDGPRLVDGMVPMAGTAAPVMVEPTIYHVPSQEQLVRSTITDAAAVFDTWQTRLGRLHDVRLAQQVAAFAGSELSTSLATFKNPVFRLERETRLIRSVMRSNRTRVRLVHQGASATGKRHEYVTFGIRDRRGRSALRAIHVGWKADLTRARRIVERTCAKGGLTVPDVVRSRVPL